MTFFKWPVCYAYEKFHFQSFQNRNLSQKIENFNSTYQTTELLEWRARVVYFLDLYCWGLTPYWLSRLIPEIFRAALAASHADSSSKERNYSTRVVTSTGR